MQDHDEFARRLTENLYEKFRKLDSGSHAAGLRDAVNFVSASLCLRCAACDVHRTRGRWRLDWRSFVLGMVIMGTAIAVLRTIV